MELCVTKGDLCGSSQARKPLRNHPTNGNEGGGAAEESEWLIVVLTPVERRVERRGRS